MTCSKTHHVVVHGPHPPTPPHLHQAAFEPAGVVHCRRQLEGASGCCPVQRLLQQQQAGHLARPHPRPWQRCRCSTRRAAAGGGCKVLHQQWHKRLHLHLHSAGQCRHTRAWRVSACCRHLYTCCGGLPAGFTVHATLLVEMGRYQDTVQLLKGGSRSAQAGKTHGRGRG